MAGIRFHINGKLHTVPNNLPATTLLNDYLRETAGLKGTKVMCREAGCGCCAVTVTHDRADSGLVETHSVQSCVTPLYAVDGWQITTVEGIGSQKKGFHPIQERIAKFNGTQCGYCTPGMVMNMYGLLHQNPNITAQDVEDNFDGNICRCTGYRPILDAMKSFAGDANIPDCKAIDIEDLNKNLCPKTGESCTGSCEPRNLDLDIDGVRWFRPQSLSSLTSVMDTNKDKRIRLVFGNTSTGIFKKEGPFDIYIDLHGVRELFSFEVTDTTARFGAATTLTQFMARLKSHQDKEGFKYFSHIHRHLKFVANVMVRNSGCIAGNLMVKHRHREFPSDIFTMLECAGAEVEICDVDCKRSSVSLLNFLKMNMADKVITAVILPSIRDDVVYRSFKITPRWQNAHAYVNAAFKLSIKNLTVQDDPSIIFGGIDTGMIHATETEKYLKNKTLTLPVIKEAYITLRDELMPAECPPDPSPKYRKDLASGLLYKVLLGILDARSEKTRSGPDHLNRPISSGLQTFQEKASEFPLKQGMPKMTAPLQASGEAQFVNDMPAFQQGLCGAFVLADVASATLDSVDASEALACPGVETFLSAKDIIGTNNATSADGVYDWPPQELFVTEEVFYNGQPIGLVLAETQAQADEAASKVKVSYKEVRKPILTIEESIAAGKEYPPGRVEKVTGDPEAAWKSVDKTVEGTVAMGSQYHFFLENHVSIAVPSEDGIDLYSSTQYPDKAQHAAACLIDKPMNYINVTVPRLGGAFGGKCFDSQIFSSAATLAAYITERPIRLNVDLATTIRMCGKRPPIIAKYKAGFTRAGDIQVIDLDLAMDNGYTPISLFFIEFWLDMGYSIPNWNVHGKCYFTNKKTMSFVRAPGSVPAALVIETVLEHVANAVNRHPIIVKEINLYKDGEVDLNGTLLSPCPLRGMWRRLMDTAEVEGRMRQVEVFNRENLWKKRGITMTACKYGVLYYMAMYNAVVSVYSKDGSVVVTQGGIEMGQGLYTKVAQGVAHALGVPVENIKIKPTQGLVSPNNFATAGSVTSEIAMQAAIGAAEMLNQRMQPIREKFPDADWKELCQKASAAKINLCASDLYGPDHNNAYQTYCIAVSETEVDILTGESQIRRVDIMADYGESLNPVIDIGQTEGAFVFGLGAYQTEDTTFDKETGRILSDGTWTYKPPSSKDIPIDWRIHLLPDSPNPKGVRSSKASGEPATGLGVGALLANKLAVESARKDVHGVDDFIPVVAPFTVERIQQSVGLTEHCLRV